MKFIFSSILTFAFLFGSVMVSFALPNCEGSARTISDYKEVSSWSNCKGTVSFGSGGVKRAGNKYVGEWKDGKIHGQGIYTFVDGAKFVGKYRDGKRNGHFTSTFPNGNKYVGKYRDNLSNGQGTHTFANGNKYVGEFRNDLYNGQGTLTWSGNKYVGEFRDGKIHGQGTYTFANGYKYVGEFRDGKKHGQGTYTTAVGQSKAQIWENGKLKPAICSNEGSQKELTLCVTKYWEDAAACWVNLTLKNNTNRRKS